MKDQDQKINSQQTLGSADGLINDERPVEMLGRVRLNESGKIYDITKIGGYYVPTDLDMYLNIKKLQQQMPSTFDEDCKIDKFGSFNGSGMFRPRTVLLKDYIKKMEGPASASDKRALHEVLREERKEELSQSSKNFKTDIFIKINGSREYLVDSLTKLSPETKEELKVALANQKSTIYFVDSEGKDPKFFNLALYTTNIIKSNNTEAMQVLLDAGISIRQEFRNERPIRSAVIQKNEAMVTMLLENEDVRRNLVHREDDLKPSILHQAAEYGTVEIIKSILKYQEGRDLLSVKDNQGHTPLHLAVASNKVERINSILNCSEGRNLLSVEDSYHKTPRQLAQQRGYSNSELAIRDVELSININQLRAAVEQKNEAMVATLLENENVRRNLVHKEENLKPSILYLAALSGNEKIIKSILEYPEGRGLLSVEYEGLTPRQLACQKNFSAAERAIRGGELSLVKDQLANYFTEQMQGKEIITTACQREMKEEVIAKLLPLALNELEKQEINKFSGSIVREAAKIAGNKLDRRQQFTEFRKELKNKIIIFFNKFSSIPEENQFRNIVKDPQFSKILKNLRKSKAISVAPSEKIISAPLPPNNKDNKRGRANTMRANLLRKER